MIFLLQIIHRIFCSPTIQQAKPFTLHLSLLLFVFVYAFFGGLMFNYLEEDATIQQNKLDQENKKDCVINSLENINTKEHNNFTAQKILETCFYTEPDLRSQWSYVTATLYGFGIVTTLGYNRIAPITLEGRLFCVLYGICGIPITMIIIANIGQYLNQFAGATRKNLELYREKRRRSSANGEDIPDSSIELMSLALLFSFLFYVCIGAILLPLLNGEFDFLNGIYFNFLCLTAIDFGQLVPARFAFLPITFLYVCLGLAITTIAIDIGSEYMKRLHNLGKKMKNVATTKIWFGGKTLKVKELLHAVGKKCGIDPYIIDHMDLENLVERVVAINEGREPPPDTNEDTLPPKEPAPPSPPPSIKSMNIQNPVVETISDPFQTFSSLEPLNNKEFNVSNLIAIDMELSEEEQCFDWDAPTIIIGHPNHRVVEQSEDISFPEELDKNTPVVLVHEQPKDTEPKKFKEKKQKYARDPKKLYATYQEEWDRLEKLSERTHKSNRKKLTGVPQSSSPDPMLLGTAGSSNETLDHPNTLSPIHTTSRRATSPLNYSLLGVHKEEMSRRASTSTPRKLNPNLYRKFGETILETKKL